MTFAHASICIFSRNGSRICDWNFTYSIWHSGNSGKYFDTDRIIFRKSWDYGKIKSGDQCASIQTGCISSICYRRRKRIFFVKLILAAIVLIAIIYWFFGTELGAAIRATGCNPQMASAQGINTSFNKVLALMISNGLVGLCGGIYAQYQGAVDVNMGRGAIVIGLAAVIISEVIFGKFCAGKKIAFALTLGAVFIGAIIYYIVIAFVLWLKMPSDYMKLFSAVAITFS